jgi:hypothetical protein
MLASLNLGLCWTYMKENQIRPTVSSIDIRSNECQFIQQFSEMTHADRERRCDLSPPLPDTGILKTKSAQESVVTPCCSGNFSNRNEVR